MDAIEAVHRAWVILAVGVCLLVLTGLQLWSGRAFVGYDWRRDHWAYRKKEPILFWANVGPIGVAGLFAVALAATRLL